MSVHSDQPTTRSSTTRAAVSSTIIRRMLTWFGVLVFLIALWIASDIAVPDGLTVWTGRLQSFVTIFLGIFIEALPFLLAGVLMSAMLQLFVSAERIQQLSPKNPLLAAIAGSLLGMAFPVCECGSIPATRRLLTKGAALPSGIAFALAAPVINPIVLISTYVAFASWEMVAWRAGLTILFAVVIGLLVGTPQRAEMVLAPHIYQPVVSPDVLYAHHQHQDNRPPDSPLRQVLNHASDEFFEMSRYLIAGSMLAAGLQTLVPQSALLALGNGPVVSVLVMIALAVVLSICSTVDAFVALSFVNTFTPGAILAFLVFGPMIDIKSTLLLMTTFRRHIVAIIVVLCFLLSLLAGVFMNFNLV